VIGIARIDTNGPHLGLHHKSCETVTYEALKKAQAMSNSSSEWTENMINIIHCSQSINKYTYTYICVYIWVCNTCAGLNMHGLCACRFIQRAGHA